MSDRGSQSQSSTLPYDTNALLCEYQSGNQWKEKIIPVCSALYGMSSGLYGAGGGSGPGGGGGGGGGGQPGWWGMAAGQLAVQDYLSRVQAAAHDPAQETYHKHSEGHVEIVEAPFSAEGILKCVYSL